MNRKKSKAQSPYSSGSGRSSRRMDEKLPDERLHAFFRPAAEWIVDHVYPIGKKAPLQDELITLAAGSRRAVREYYENKFTALLLSGSTVLLLILCLFLLQRGQDRSIAGGVLTRPGYGEADQDRQLNVIIAGQEKSENIEVHLSARRFSDSEVRKLLARAEEELKTAAAGVNDSLDLVRSSLVLPTTLQNGLVSASYGTDPADMIDENGDIIGKPDKKGTIVQIDAQLTCQDQERDCRFAAVLYPRALSEEEQVQEDIRSALDSADRDAPESASVSLPKEIGGHALHWSYPADSSILMLAALLVLLPVFLYVRSDEKVREEIAERRQQLDLDYSELLWKMTMLLGAGLTIRGTMERITSQYEKNRSVQKQQPSGGASSTKRFFHLSSGELRPSFFRHSQRHGKPASPRRYLYEELRITLREIESGVPEAAAYENFGRRCQLPSYIKLGSILSQNLTKGSRGLTETLEREAGLSLDQHKTAARKLGERASMKLLMPMILMLMVVLAILMVPAMLSM